MENISNLNNEFLYNEFFKPLFRYLFFRTKDYDLASDLTQITFIKFFEKNYEINDVNYSKNILFKIAYHSLIDHYRKEKIANDISLDDSIDIADNSLNIEENLVKKEDIEFMKLIIDKLAPMEKDIVLLRLSSEVDYKSISKVLNISESNARKIYSRALNKVEVLVKESNYF